MRATEDVKQSKRLFEYASKKQSLKSAAIFIEKERADAAKATLAALQERTKEHFESVSDSIRARFESMVRNN
jgi:hypothetical protein